MIFVIAESEVRTKQWCNAQNIRYPDRNVACLHTECQVGGQRWQPGSRLVILGAPSHARHFIEVLFSCGMPSDTKIEHF